MAKKYLFHYFLYSLIAFILGLIGVFLSSLVKEKFLLILMFSLMVISFGFLSYFSILFIIKSFKNEYQKTKLKKVSISTSYFLLTIIFLYSIYLVFAIDTFKYQKDLTKQQKYSLSNRSIETVKKVNKKLKIFIANNNVALPKDFLFLQFYGNLNNNVTIEIINIDKDFALTKKYDLTYTGTVILELEGNKNFIKLLPNALKWKKEYTITTAILSLLNQKRKKIIFLNKDGNNTSSKFTGYSFKVGNSLNRVLSFERLKKRIQFSNIGFSSLKSNLPKFGDIKDLLLIIRINGIDLDQVSFNSINDYINKNGAIIFLIDPNPLSTKNQKSFTYLNQLLERFNISQVNDLVVDFQSFHTTLGYSNDDYTYEEPYRCDQLCPILEFNEQHVINNLLEKYNSFVALNSATSFKSNTSNNFVKVLVKSRYTAWGETNFQEEMLKGNINYSFPQDFKGPRNIILLKEDQAKQQRSMFFGDSDFISDALIDIGSNFDFFLNSIHWTLNQEDLISLEFKANDFSNKKIGIFSTFKLIVASMFFALFFLILGISFITLRKKYLS